MNTASLGKNRQNRKLLAGKFCYLEGKNKGKLPHTGEKSTLLKENFAQKVSAKKEGFFLQKKKFLRSQFFSTINHINHFVFQGDRTCQQYTEDTLANKKSECIRLGGQNYVFLQISEKNKVVRTLLHQMSHN